MFYIWEYSQYGKIYRSFIRKNSQFGIILNVEDQEILFYGQISNFSVASFINRLADAKQMRRNIDVLANSAGGDADAGWGFVISMRDFPFRKKLSVHGSAFSMMAFAALFVDEVVAIEQSLFLFHRAAAFFEEFEQDPGFRDTLDKRNATLRKAMEEKLDIPAFERITGVTLDQLFSMDGRVEVTLTAEQAQEVGLVTEVRTLSASETEQINDVMMAASSGVGIRKIEVNTNIMDIDELKKRHPELYASVVEIGKKEAVPSPAPGPAPTPPPAPTLEVAADNSEQSGIEKERARVAAWEVWREVDSKKVSEGILSGQDISPADTQAFLLASAKQNFAGSLQDQDTPPATPGAEDGDPNQKDEYGLTPELQQMSANVVKKIISSQTKK